MVWTCAALMFWALRRRRLYLPDLPATEPEGGWPRVALLFAARNEAPEIERATRTMLALDYPHLRIVAVDDRSTDHTGKILDRLAAEHERLEVIHIDSLPPGWLGKNHALHRAASLCDDDWILCTDADVRYAPLALKQAVSFATSRGYGHVTVLPGPITETVWERLFLSFFGIFLALSQPPFLTDSPHFKHAIGVGAFNLVRGDALRAIDGFEHLRLSVDDDMRLAEALKRSGQRSKALIGADGLTMRWHSTVPGFIKGLEKNAFAAMEFRLAMVALVYLVVAVVGLGPWLGVLFGNPVERRISLVGIIALALILKDFRRGVGSTPWLALLWPIGALYFAVAVGNSTWKTLQRGGIVWRDSFYALSELKQHVQERRRWFAELRRSR